MRQWKKGLAAAPPTPPRTTFPVPVTSTTSQQLPTESEDSFTPRPSGKYVSIDERVLLTGVNSSFGATIRLTMKVFQPNGRYIEPSVDISLSSTGAITPTPLRIGPGWIVGIIVLVVSGTVNYGECFVRVGLFRGDAISEARQHDVLLQGDVSSTRPLGLDTPIPYAQNSGQLVQISISALVLPTGVTIGDIVTTGWVNTMRHTLFVANFNWNADGTVANRYVQIEILTAVGGSVIWLAKSKVAQPASTTYMYVFGDVDSETVVYDNTVHVKYPTVPILGTNAYRITAVNKGPTDTVIGSMWLERKTI